MVALHSMSLHTRCQQRIARRSVQRTVWRQQSVRCYASSTAEDPEWFQKLRSEMLSRKPSRYRENLDPLHYRQLRATLKGFQADPRSGSVSATMLSDVLTRFNARLPSSMLLSDGTDALHSPGEPWQRRMWAGGAVTINPSLKIRSDTPFKLRKDLVCVERIKDVRLQGSGTDAKIFVTIERRFSPDQDTQSAVKRRRGGESPGDGAQQVVPRDEWSDTMLKEERSLVFLKSITARAVQTLEPRYLKSPTDPEYSYSLTPTRDLLFRYSALTFNAHLLHLDPTYARTIEGHRNLLVHGPLTLTLMLQALNKHITPQTGERSERVTSLEYRNLAPLYCDEAMRVCVKKRKGVDKVNIWDVWIEGPTGGMAVKAVARTTPRELARDDASKYATRTDIPTVETVAAQARRKLNALDQKNASSKQLSDVSRASRSILPGQGQQHSVQSARKAKAAVSLSYLYSKSSPLVVRVAKPLSRSKRRKLQKQDQQNPTQNARGHRIAAPLSYLYSLSSPLVVRSRKLRAEPYTENAADDPSGLEAPIFAEKGGRMQRFGPYSRSWRQWRVGNALRYLYLGAHSPLLSPVVVPRQAQAGPANKPKSRSSAVADTSPSASPAVQYPAKSPLATAAASTPPSRPLRLAQRQRTMLLASTPPITHQNTPATSELRIRKVEPSTADGEEVGPVSRTKKQTKPFRVRKMEHISVRKVDIPLQEAARKRMHGKRVKESEVRRREKSALKRDDLGRNV